MQKGIRSHSPQGSDFFSLRFFYFRNSSGDQAAKRTRTNSQRNDGSNRTTLAMARSDLIEIEGVVTKFLGFGVMEVTSENVTVKAKSSGKLLKRNIKILVGDRVKVGVSPYDPSHGIVTWRYR